MRGLLLLFAIYGLFIIYGISTAEAARGGPGADNIAHEESIKDLSWAERDAQSATANIENVLERIDEMVGLDKLIAVFEEAAQKHPQIAELILILQEYGVFTDLEVPEEAREAFQKKLAENH